MIQKSIYANDFPNKILINESAHAQRKLLESIDEFMYSGLELIYVYLLLNFMDLILHYTCNIT